MCEVYQTGHFATFGSTADPALKWFTTGCPKNQKGLIYEELVNANNRMLPIGATSGQRSSRFGGQNG
jgi:hypothetical protein